jgi:hypothetical protein
MVNCGLVLALGGNHNAEVLRDNCMPGRNFQRSAIGRFRFTKTSSFVKRYRGAQRSIATSANKAIDFLGQICHASSTLQSR